MNTDRERQLQYRSTWTWTTNGQEQLYDIGYNLFSSQNDKLFVSNGEPQQ